MKKRMASILIAGALAAAVLTGCGSSGMSAAADTEKGEISGDAVEDAASSEETAKEKLDYDGEIRVWTVDSAVNFTMEQIEKFQKANPGIAHAVFTVEAVSESDAADRMNADAGDGADVYVFAQDQLARLAAGGVLAETAPEYVETVQADNDEGSVLAATVGTTLYAYPLTSDNGYLMYYDKSVVTDPSDLDAILADCEKAGKNFYMEINSGWYQTAFFFGTGCELSYETDSNGNFTGAEVDYASDKGVTALREMIRLKNSSAFVNGSAAGDAEKIGAIVDGTWDAETVREALGDGYACAKLPSFQGSDGNTYQMSGFSGYRLIGVKPQEDEEKEKVCHALAACLSGEEVQLSRYKAIGWGPSNRKAQQSEEVQTDAALCALNEQMLIDRPQGQYPGDYWTLATGLGDDVNTKTLNTKTSDADLMAALQTFQDACISYAEKTEN